MVKVLHVFEYFDQGGIENFVMNVYRNIDRDKYSFDFAFINRSKGYFDDEVVSYGGNIYYFDTEKKTFSNYYKSLKRIIKEHGPFDVIHSHMYYFSGIILLIARLQGIQTRIAHSHETFKGRKPTIVRKTYELVMRLLIRVNATQLLSCSNIAGKCVFGEKANCNTLYNGIDVERFRFNEKKRNDIRRTYNLQGKVVLLCVGRFADQKNHMFLINFFKKLLEKIENAELILIGNGVLKDSIVSKIKELNIEDKVVILSGVSNTEDFYSASDLFVLPAKYEGMSIVSVEAQVSGLSCLLSDNVPTEIDYTDLVVHLSLNEDESIWIEKAKQLLEIERNRSKYYKNFLDSEFDIMHTVKELCEIYG